MEYGRTRRAARNASGFLPITDSNSDDKPNTPPKTLASFVAVAKRMPENLRISTIVSALTAACAYSSRPERARPVPPRRTSVRRRDCGQKREGHSAAPRSGGGGRRACVHHPSIGGSVPLGVGLARPLHGRVPTHCSATYWAQGDDTSLASHRCRKTTSRGIAARERQHLRSSRPATRGSCLALHHAWTHVESFSLSPRIVLARPFHSARAGPCRFT